MLSTGQVRSVGFYSHGSPAFSPVSAHVRVLQRVRNAPKAKLRFVRLDPRFVASQDFSEFSAILVQRDAVPDFLVETLIRNARICHTRLIVELDDALWDAPKETPGHKHLAEYAPHLLKLMDASELVLVATPTLASSVESMGMRSVVAENALPDDLWFDRSNAAERFTRTLIGAPAKGQLRLLFMGQQTFDPGLQTLTSALAQLRAQGLDVSLTILGGVGEGSEAIRYEPVPARFIEYPRFVSFFRGIAPSFDVGVVPYVDSYFNRNKSFLKFLDYSAAGLPGIYSRLPQYEDIVADQIDGVLCAGDVESWVQAIASLSDEAFRERLTSAAYEKVTTQYRLSRHMDAWLDCLSLIGRSDV